MTKQIQDTLTKFIKINLNTKNNIEPLKSKILGVPYFENNFDLLKKLDNFQFFVQINFEDCPKVENIPLPSQGIFQVYFSRDNDCYGLTFNHNEPIGFHIVFWENPKSENYFATEQFSNQMELPLDNECEILFSTSQETLYEIDEYNLRKFEVFDPEADNTGHKIGGYAYFTQSDPRYNLGLSDDWLLLLQLDTDDSVDMMWGDCGVANFFIKKQDLLNKDFSNILYNWDCC